MTTDVIITLLSFSGIYSAVVASTYFILDKYGVFDLIRSYIEKSFKCTCGSKYLKHKEFTGYKYCDKPKKCEFFEGGKKLFILKLLECTFCICFWIGVFYALIGVIIGAPLITLLTPFAVASLARFIMG